MKSIIVLLLFFSLTSVASKNNVEEGLFIFDSQKEYLPLFEEHELIIDHLSESGYELYGPKGLGLWLKDLEINSLPLDKLESHDHSSEKALQNYPAPEEIDAEVKKLVDANSDILKRIHLGKSSGGRDLWAVKMSDNVHIDEREPEFKYIGNMHGNEIVGREVLVLFLKDMVQRYRNRDPLVRQAVRNLEIFVLPSMNPDGANQRRRGNSRNYDLNRNFPDFTLSNDQNTMSGRQPETKAIMKWQARRHFSLSANFHGGTQCVNYPWDTSSHEAPLTGLIKKLSLLYASKVPGMYNSSRFRDGITNGYQWYEVNGGMQDWSYYWHNDLQVTIELSNQKWPRYESRVQFYQDNRWSLLNYLLQIHQGVGFYYKNKQTSGSVEIIDSQGSSLGEFGFYEGEFYKVLPIGDYEFIITSKEGRESSLNVRVKPYTRNSRPSFYLVN